MLKAIHSETLQIHETRFPQNQSNLTFFISTNKGQDAQTV